MRRKLVRQGDNAHTITLPASWIKDRNLQAKDEVIIKEYEDSLIISSEQKDINKSIKLTLNSDSEKYITAILRNLYINGYDEIKIKFTSDKVFKKISEANSNLIGYELENIKDNNCIIKNYNTPSSKEYESIFKKVFYITFMIADLTKEGLTNNLDEKINQLNKDSSKFSCYARRIIFKANISKEEDGITKYSIINVLHMIARNFATINDKSNKLSNKTKQYYDKILKDLRTVFEAYCNKNLSEINKILEERNSTLSQAFKIKNDQEIIHYLAEISRLTGTIAGKVGFLIATLPP